jgi:hypothetical protein
VSSMIDDKLLSSISQEDQVEPFLSMENIDLTMLKSLKPWPFSDHSLQSSPLLPNLTQNGFRSLSGRSETGRGSAILAENFPEFAGLVKQKF